MSETNGIGFVPEEAMIPYEKNKPGATSGREEEFRSKYLERRALTKKSDGDLIAWSTGKKGERGSCSFGHQAADILSEDIERNKDIISPRLRNRKVIDVGSGEETFSTGLQTFSSSPNKDGRHQTDYHSAPSEYVGVDLFLDADLTNTQGREYLTRAIKDLPEEQKEDLVQRIHLVRSDGLEYLISQEDQSSNVFFANINYSLINSSDYLKRLAQEAFRVAGSSDVVACTLSSDIAEEASRLFPHSIRRGQTIFFSKESFPPIQVVETHSIKLFEKIKEWADRGHFSIKELTGLKRDDDMAASINNMGGGYNLAVYARSLGFDIDAIEYKKALEDSWDMETGEVHDDIEVSIKLENLPDGTNVTSELQSRSSADLDDYLKSLDDEPVLMIDSYFETAQNNEWTNKVEHFLKTPAPNQLRYAVIHVSDAGAVHYLRNYRDTPNLYFRFEQPKTDIS